MHITSSRAFQLLAFTVPTALYPHRADAQWVSAGAAAGVAIPTSRMAERREIGPTGAVVLGLGTPSSPVRLEASFEMARHSSKTELSPGKLSVRGFSASLVLGPRLRANDARLVGIISLGRVELDIAEQRNPYSGSLRIGAGAGAELRSHHWIGRFEAQWQAISNDLGLGEFRAHTFVPVRLVVLRTL